MPDKSLLFTGSNVRALLEDRKTQTRRLLPLGSPPRGSGTHPERRLIRPWDGAPAFYQWQWRATHGTFIEPVKLRIHVGDRIYAREAWRAEARLDKKAPRDINTNYPGVKYIATDEPDDFGIEGKFRQAMHMPRWASRITLIVTDVRVERLQGISEKDAIAEGIEQIKYEGNDPAYIGAVAWKDYTIYPDGTPHVHAVAGWKSPIHSYKSLWDAINGDGAWDKNPYITAITFDVIKQNIDQL